MKKEKLKEIIASLGTNIIKYKYLILILIIGLVLVSILGTQRLKIDSSNESFLPDNDPLIVKNEQFKKLFGNQEFVFILVESDEIFDHDVLMYIRQVTDDLKNNLPFVDKVTSLSNLDYIDTDNYSLKVDDLIGDEIPENKDALNGLKKKVLARKTYVNKIITKDSQKTGIIVTLKEMPKNVYARVDKNFSPLDEVNYPADKVLMASDLVTDKKDGFNRIEDPRKVISPALNVILSRNKQKGIKTTATGVPLLDYESDLLVAKESSKLGLIALIAAIILMLVLFRSLRAIIGIFLVISFTLIILFGTLGWLNITLSPLIIIIPALVLVVSVGYSIHYINHFQYAFEDKSRKEAVRYAYRESIWPIFITAVTTALGFAANIFVPLKPIKVAGLACGIGAFLTYLLVMTIIPIIFSIGSEKKKYSLTRIRKNSFRKFMGRWADYVEANIAKTVIFTLILVIIFTYFALQIPVNSDMLQILGDDVKCVKNARYISDRLGALYSYEVLIEFPREDMAKKASVLKEIDGLSKIIGKLNNTAAVNSFTDLIKELNMTMHNNQQTYYRIPDSNNLISQYLLLYEMSGGEDLEDYVDFAYQKTHISTQINIFKGSNNQDFQKIIDYGKNHFPEGTKITVLEDIPVLMKMVQRLVNGQILSILAALLVITLIMIIVLKSVKLGLLSMIPNIIPVLVIIGLMGLLHYPLDIMTVLIAPMIIGIAVDDTVHYFVHFKEEYNRTGSYHLANKATFSRIGKALISTSIVLMIGFGVFSLSRLESMRHIAVLAAAGIFSALAADMLITPAVIMYIKPYEKIEITKKKEEKNL